MYFVIYLYLKAKNYFPSFTVKTVALLEKLEYQTTLPASWEICMQVKKQQLEPDMEQGTCSK